MAGKQGIEELFGLDGSVRLHEFVGPEPVHLVSGESNGL